MRRKCNRLLLGLVLFIAFALPLYAYQVALKDGRVFHFEKYRVDEEGKLFYFGEDGKEIAIPLESIDMERTRQLNAREPVPLDLPGMAIPPSKQNQNTEPSLGEIARKAKKDDKRSTTKRVFTDDDVMHSTSLPSSDAVGPPSSQTADQTQVALNSAEAFANSLADKTERQLGDIEVGMFSFQAATNGRRSFSRRKKNW